VKNKLINLETFKECLKDGMTIMFGGFMGVGTPEKLVAAIIDSGIKNLTLIGNDTAFPDTGVGPLITNGQVRKVIVSHIGTNPETGKKMFSGEMEVELVPQGSLIERIRSGGFGLGGVLTQTGLGTVVTEGKQIVDIDNQRWLLEKPLKADLAIIQANEADMAGNLTYNLTARNFNPMIALAAERVVVQAQRLVAVGKISPEHVVTPAALVDHLIEE